MNIKNEQAGLLLSFAWRAATLNKGTLQGGVIDRALASGPCGAIHPVSVDVTFFAILMARWKGCNSCFLVQLGKSCPNESHYLLVSMLGARPTIVLLPFPRTIGAFHPLGRLRLAAGCRC